MENNNMNHTLRFAKANWTKNEVLNHKQTLKSPHFWDLHETVKHWLLIHNKNVMNKNKTHLGTAQTGRF